MGITGNIVEVVFKSFIVILKFEELLLGEFMVGEACAIGTIPVFSMESRLFVNIFSEGEMSAFQMKPSLTCFSATLNCIL